mmetsp:Transcript_4386/g.11931  ORF Transcript_4386/g.11931 Transcript_4386/m.11931 type:complete len:314 (-) Transcript_4386:984-1925(-)
MLLRKTPTLPLHAPQHSLGLPVFKARFQSTRAGRTYLPGRGQDAGLTRASVVVKAGDDQALRAFASLTGKKLDDAARRYAAGVAEEIDEDLIVAAELGADDYEGLSDIQKQYFGKVKDKLSKRAEELERIEAEEKLRVSKSLQLGKDAYAIGEYGASVSLLEAATVETEANAAMLGEAQTWLALAYQACGRERDCVELYRYMENNHPLPKFKKQAAQLRYIIEAPKLTLSKEEYVKVPQIQSDTWMQKKRKSKVPQMKRREPTEEELKKKKRAYWDRDWSMPGLEYIPDKWYVRVAWATTFIVFTVYANSKLM